MFLGGGAAGAVFLLASIVTKGAVGIGDGYILMVCGMVLGLYQVVILSILALCLASAFGILLWVRKKAGRHTITLWIIFALCYLSLFSHDQAVLYSSGQRCLRENYSEKKCKEVMQKQLFILKIDDVDCNTNVLYRKLKVKAKIVMTAPFLSSQKEYCDEMQIENWTCSKRLWDTEWIKKE